MRAGPPPAPRGLALLAVLWITAALAVLAQGLGLGLREELAVARGLQQGVQLAARADAALLGLIQGLLLRRPLLLRQVETLPGEDAEGPWVLRIEPLNGLIDLNRAPAGLLQALLMHRAGWPEAAARAQAQAWLAWRGQVRPDGRPLGFESVEDLLQAGGLDFATYTRIEPCVTVEAGGTGRVNPLAAPPEVLAVLAGGQAARAEAIAARREQAGTLLDTSGLDPAWAEVAPTSRVRLVAVLPLPDGRRFERAWRVSLAPGQTSSSGLPWRVLGRQQQFLAPEPRP